MNKLYYIFVSLLVAVAFTGCKKKADIDHPIAGHTYAHYTDTDYGYLISYAEFHVKGNFTMLYVTHNIYQGDESNRFSECCGVWKETIYQLRMTIRRHSNRLEGR